MHSLVSQRKRAVIGTGMRSWKVSEFIFSPNTSFLSELQKTAALHALVAALGLELLPSLACAAGAKLENG